MAAPREGSPSIFSTSLWLKKGLGRSRRPALSKATPFEAMRGDVRKIMAGGTRTSSTCSIMAKCSASPCTRNSRTPKYNAASMHPKLQTSANTSQSRPRITSGARICRAPTRTPGRSSPTTAGLAPSVPRGNGGTAAPPKSMSTASHGRRIRGASAGLGHLGCATTSNSASRSMTFVHLMSVCASPERWTKARPARSCRAMAWTSVRKRPLSPHCFMTFCKLDASGWKTRQMPWSACMKVPSSLGQNRL
mmetsp:Transcript_42905/g.118643  ORF Transcript_42905/g.118643 Transcript_42905/m.118643 type:complete len:249 (-) Transcript_42905:687-1433(-)